MKATGWLCASVLLLGLLTHLNSLGGSFHYDDAHSIVENPHVRRLAEIPGYFIDPATFSSEPTMAMYRPVVLTTYVLTYALCGYLAWPYLLFNVVVHALVACLVFLLVEQKMGRATLAWWAGALFAVHPLHTQVANYISSRSESLAVLGVFAAVYWVGRGDRGRGLVAYALALLSKAVAVVGAPFFILWSQERPPRRVWIPFAGLTGGYLSLIVANQFLTRSLAQDVRSYGVQLYTQTKALVYYGYLLAAPVQLSVEHPFVESQTLGEGPVLLAGLVVVSLLFIAWRGRGSAASVGLGIFFLGLGIPLLVPLNVLVNEHRVYLSFFGVLYAVFSSLGQCRPGITRASWGLLLVLALLTWQRNEVWRDEFSLWSAAAIRAPDAFRVQSNLGLALYERDELAIARRVLKQALELNPRYGRTWSNMGLVYEELGEYPAAEQAYQKALELRPDLVGIHANLGRLYVGLRRYDEARAALDQALALDAQSVVARTNLGLLHQRAGRLERAVREYERVLALGPLTAEAYNNLGLAYQDLGRWGEAEDALRRAAERDSEDGAAEINLQILRLRREGRAPIDIYEVLTRQYADRPELWRKLATEYAAIGRVGEAIAACRQILVLDPRDQQALANLEKLLKSQPGN